MKCIRIGHGCVATWHDRKLKEQGVTTLGVIDSNAKKRKSALESGLQVFSSCGEASRLKPDLWDICVSTDFHLDALTAITAFDPNANIIVEKPICPFSHIDALKNFWRIFKVKSLLINHYGLKFHSLED